MVITAQKVESIIKGTIGFVPDGMSALEVTNDVGEMLVNMRAWNWLKDNFALLSFVKDQAYIDLPTDVRDIISLYLTSSRTQAIEPSTLREIQELRTAAIGQPQDYVFAMSAHQGAGAPTYRIELFPTPDADDENVLTLWYHAAWTVVSSDSTALSMPIFMEGVYQSLVRAVVRGRQEEDKAEARGDFSGIQARIAAIEAGPEMDWAKRRDTELHRRRGKLRGGIAQDERPTWFWDRSITGPSV